MSLSIQFDGLTLANVAEGRLEERFQELLARVVEINQNAHEYKGSPSGERISRIRLEVEFRYLPAIAGDPASLTIDASGELSAQPKSLKKRQAGYMRDGAILIEANPATQLEAFDKSVGRQ